MAAGLKEFASYLKEMRPTGEFIARPFYEPKTDSLIYYARDARSYGKRLNELITLFLSTTDNSLVGCELKGVKRLMKRVDGVIVFVHDHKIKLSLLMGIALAPEPDDEELVDRYRDELLESTEPVEVDAHDLEMCCT